MLIQTYRVLLLTGALFGIAQTGVADDKTRDDAERSYKQCNAAHARRCAAAAEQTAASTLAST